ncbi:MAG: hypothetical protein KIT39_20935, partial [Nitrospirales bacterium]|nr:hypothetical protein [Nitrospirales bacterium]
SPGKEQHTRLYPKVFDFKDIAFVFHAEDEKSSLILTNMKQNTFGTLIGQGKFSFPDCHFWDLTQDLESYTKQQA